MIYQKNVLNCSLGYYGLWLLFVSIAISPFYANLSISDKVLTQTVNVVIWPYRLITMPICFVYSKLVNFLQSLRMFSSIRDVGNLLRGNAVATGVSPMFKKVTMGLTTVFSVLAGTGITLKILSDVYKYKWVKNQVSKKVEEVRNTLENTTNECKQNLLKPAESRITQLREKAETISQTIKTTVQQTSNKARDTAVAVLNTVTTISQQCKKAIETAPQQEGATVTELSEQVEESIVEANPQPISKAGQECKVAIMGLINLFIANSMRVSKSLADIAITSHTALQTAVNQVLQDRVQSARIKLDVNVTKYRQSNRNIRSELVKSILAVAEAEKDAAASVKIPNALRGYAQDVVENKIEAVLTDGLNMLTTYPNSAIATYILYYTCKCCFSEFTVVRLFVFAAFVVCLKICVKTYYYTSQPWKKSLKEASETSVFTKLVKEGRIDRDQLLTPTTVYTQINIEFSEAKDKTVEMFSEAKDKTVELLKNISSSVSGHIMFSEAKDKTVELLKNISSSVCKRRLRH